MLVRVAEGRKAFIYLQYVVIALFVVMNTIALIFILINCVPVEAAWNAEKLKNGGHCQPSYVLADVYYACTAVNILTDWVTAGLPIPLLWNVHLDRSTKISVSALMGLGIFASLSACIRLKYTVALTSQVDFLFKVADVVIWGFAENGIGMMVGNIATLRPLFRTLRHRNASDYKSHKDSPRFNSPRRLGESTSSRELELENGKHLNHVVTQIDHTLYSSLSAGDSQKDILGNVQQPGQADIVVSRQVVVAYE
ncbi:hypothetical protein N7462_008296 [Penicillium macrosclerotiorum]|uniref:uncharacterized protein n=1 Tax=Penicillium macrosclerotiorum TaxID=303699 RepID=UPI00254808B4|nr:uncharacterized protein N7462_008296 [Penicillium macrosclerotiorum]KAJ5675399.1 hypothetical protein N7462_008296 [Penicillium macrosclerotiorum]